MTPEKPSIQDLSQEDIFAADAILESTGLVDQAEFELTMYGQTGTLRYGIGKCYKYFGELETTDIRELLLNIIKDQESAHAKDEQQ